MLTDVSRKMVKVIKKLIERDYFIQNLVRQVAGRQGRVGVLLGLSGSPDLFEILFNSISLFMSTLCETPNDLRVESAKTQ